MLLTRQRATLSLGLQLSKTAGTQITVVGIDSNGIIALRQKWSSAGGRGRHFPRLLGIVIPCALSVASARALSTLSAMAKIISTSTQHIPSWHPKPACA